MTTEVHDQEIEKLLETLYEHKRIIQSQGFQEPTFVFYCAKDQRYEIERRFLAYIQKKGGYVDPKDLLSYGGDSKTASYFHFPDSTAVIMLLEK